MKIIRFKLDEKSHIGKLEGDKIFILSNEYNFNDDMLLLIKSQKNPNTLKFDTSTPLDLNKVELLSPINRTENDVLCIGLNYRDHIEETKRSFKSSEYATYFSKRAEFISGPNDNIELDTEIDSSMDYETELGVIIGKRGKNIKEDEAYSYIFGYTILNDYSARELQQNHNQFFKGKSLDGYTSIGPCIVTVDEIKTPINLNLETRVNEEVRQKSNTKYMIRNVATQISELSQGLTLVPGDIIATGTPKGVGLGFNPPKYLKSGDIVESKIENIGILKNIIK